MKKNVGTIDAIFRITIGLFGLAWATARMVRDPYHTMPGVVALLSAMKVAEGITRYCPMLELIGIDTLEEKKHRAVAKRVQPATAAQDKEQSYLN